MTDLARVAELQRKSHMLVDWLGATGIPFDEALPILAVTIGTILKQQMRGVPTDKYKDHLNEGIEIAHAMIVAAALLGPGSEGT